MIETPNVKSSEKIEAPRKGRPRKEKPDSSDFERYADIIMAYRDLLKLSALDEDIRLGSHGRCTVPHDRDKLIKWVQDPKNLDLVAESFRRVCSGYVSTGRLFAVQSGPFYMDWYAVKSMLKTSYDALYSANVFMNINLEGRYVLEGAVSRLDEALKTIKEVSESVELADLLASLPVRRGDAVDEA